MIKVDSFVGKIGYTLGTNVDVFEIRVGILWVIVYHLNEENIN